MARLILISRNNAFKRFNVRQVDRVEERAQLCLVTLYPEWYLFSMSLNVKLLEYVTVFLPGLNIFSVY